MAYGNKRLVLLWLGIYLSRFFQDKDYEKKTMIRLAVTHVTAKGNPAEPFLWPYKFEDGKWFVRVIGWFGRRTWREVEPWEIECSE